MYHNSRNRRNFATKMFYNICLESKVVKQRQILVFVQYKKHLAYDKILRNLININSIRNSLGNVQ